MVTLKRKRKVIHDLMTYSLLGHLAASRRMIERFVNSPEYKDALSEGERKHLKETLQLHDRVTQRVHMIYQRVKKPA